MNPGGPCGHIYHPDRGKDNPKTYYIPGPEWGSILAIDTATGRILDAIVGGNQCTGLDVSPDGSLLAFSDFLDNTGKLVAEYGRWNNHACVKTLTVHFQVGSTCKGCFDPYKNFAGFQTRDRNLFDTHVTFAV